MNTRSHLRFLPYARINYFFFSFVSTFLFSTLAQAQLNPTQGGGNSGGGGGGAKERQYDGKHSVFLNDTIKQIYGVKTTKYTTEEALFFNRRNYVPIDTSVINYHRWVWVQRFNYRFQDLGNMGTALNPIFPEINLQNGQTSGYQAFKPYFDLQPVLLYDTKSPYTQMRLVWGGKGRAYSNIIFSRNVHERWNVGFNYRPILVDKQILRTRKGDRQTISHYYSFHSTYFSKNKKFFSLFLFQRMRHRVEENGGVFFVNNDSPTWADYYKDTAQPALLAVENEEYRRRIHFFTHYQINSWLQAYHRVDIEKQKNTFRDVPANESNYSSVFKQTIVTPGVDSVKVSNGTMFSTVENEVGVKGGKKFFYNGYFKLRRYQNLNVLLNDYALPQERIGHEQYVGGKLNAQLDSLWKISTSLDYMLQGRYTWQASVETPWLEGSMVSVLAKPGMQQQMYKGAHDFWLQAFKNTFSNQVTGFLKWQSHRFSFFAGGQYAVFSNRTFYSMQKVSDKLTTIRPSQSSGTQQYLAPQIKTEISLSKKFKFRFTGIYTKILDNADDVLQIPERFANAQLTYEYYLFNKAIFVQAGFDAHYQSAYYAYNYAPTIQQFYVQKDFQIPSYTLLDVFFNGQFKGGRFFVKGHNLLAMKFAGSHYMPTPAYPGVGTMLDFGFDLHLYD